MGWEDTVMTRKDIRGYRFGVGFWKVIEEQLKAQAEITWDKAMREVVERLEAWRAQGTHLISDEAIKAIKDWGLK